MMGLHFESVTPCLEEPPVPQAGEGVLKKQLLQLCCGAAILLQYDDNLCRLRVNAYNPQQEDFDDATHGFSEISR